ncbi:MAG: Hsp20/alpha crystallin family protein [Methanomicrobia archaeon]|nr:Hsp20/alpha crystallin family protein [Methanomicrobia archaeon]
MVSKKMMEQGSIVQELDAEVYRKIAGALASKQFELETTIEIERKKREGRWIIELWSEKPEKAKRAIKEVIGEAGITETLKIPAEELKKEKEIFAEVREDEEGHLVVLAELPGVEEEDIGLEVENVLRISVNVKNQNRKYSKEVLLPEPAKIISKTYKNNILEVKLKKEVEKQE